MTGARPRFTIRAGMTLVAAAAVLTLLARDAPELFAVPLGLGVLGAPFWAPPALSRLSLRRAQALSLALNAAFVVAGVVLWDHRKLDESNAGRFVGLFLTGFGWLTFCVAVTVGLRSRRAAAAAEHLPNDADPIRFLD